MKKQKIFEILITAAISAGIAFLQTLLAHVSGLSILDTNTALAGSIGATIHSIRNFKI